MLDPTCHNGFPTRRHLVDNGNIHISKSCDSQRPWNGSRRHHEDIWVVALFP